MKGILWTLRLINIKIYKKLYEKEKKVFFFLKYPSKLGHSAFACKLLRLPAAQTSNNPCVGTYEVELRKSPTKSLKPFNVGAKKAERIQFLTPA